MSYHSLVAFVVQLENASPYKSRWIMSTYWLDEAKAEIENMWKEFL